MSLINDALRRTRDAAIELGSNSSPTTPAYHIDHGPAGLAFGPRSVIALTGLLTVLAAAAIIIFSTRIWRSMSQVKHAFDTRVQVVQPKSPPAAPVAPAPATTDQPQVAPSDPGKNGSKTPEDQLVARVLERIKTEQPPAPLPAAVPEPPRLVLQGITTQGSTREAMINGFTVREGDDIDGARVTAIESHLVRLQAAGREIVLRIP